MGEKFQKKPEDAAAQRMAEQMRDEVLRIDAENRRGKNRSFSAILGTKRGNIGDGRQNH
ncbi:MAG: hypothetical protein LUI14_02125 [Lachnospiraceae bacterium]|nr:hypothetical protein [Lachnospiraceae bacterium]